MSKISNLELAYTYLSGLQDSATFEDIWNNISRNIEGENSHKNEIIAELYSDLVLDNRFALTFEGKWGLRSFLKFEDVKKQYDYVDKFETTEEFEDIESYMDDDFKTIDIMNKHFKTGSTFTDDEDNVNDDETDDNDTTTNEDTFDD
ncbi:DNA-directed RNA polymerase subunit delta [Spiroplasma endosymbiont of Labia minor]|uniref:DNA-directed RNA polymerase subunit delta n=1 Tax=Spiroplasma endosymbiont of Labia minor TaxID=3066305 RepID=UPI0030CD4673